MWQWELMEGKPCLDRFFSLSVVASEAAETVPNRLNGSRMREAELFLERWNNGSSGESKPGLAEPLSNLLQVELLLSVPHALPGSVNCS